MNIVDRDAIIVDLAVRDVVEAVDQVGNGGLARAGGAHESQLLAGLGEKADVVEDGFALLIGEVHIIKAHVARQLGIGEAPVLLGNLPGPQIGALTGFLEGAVLVIGHVDQGDGAVILLGGLIHQVKNPLSTGQSHDHRVELLRDLADWVGQTLGELEEGCDDTQGNTAPQAIEGQRSAHHGDDHILDVANVDEDGHEDIGVLVGLISAFKQGVIHTVKALLGLLLVAENLDHLLAVDHFFDIAVQIA